MTKPTQPFLVKEGNRTQYSGTRSYCMTKLAKGKKNGDRVVKNPKFWIKKGR